MTNPSIADNDTPRRSRARRREAMVNAIATVLGCMALVVMIATVVRVVMVKLWESARVNPEYVQSVYDNDLDRRWSGNASTQPSLLNEPSQEQPQDAPRQPTMPPSSADAVPPAKPPLAASVTTPASCAVSPPPCSLDLVNDSVIIRRA
ncbi:MAG: hypothetical protein U1A53_15920, partial [Prosthecobacter sp.]